MSPSIPTSTHRLVPFCCLTTVLEVAGEDVPADIALAEDWGDDQLWNYGEDESMWPGLKCQGGGYRQSPIDIKTKHVVDDTSEMFISYTPLEFFGYKRVLCSGINNGHTIQFSSEGDEAIHSYMTGGPLKGKYRLEQVHFHMVSEHSIDGVKYPMEIHFVHVKNDMTVKKAISIPDGLAIVAVFVNVQYTIFENKYQALREVVEVLPKLSNVGDVVSGLMMDLSILLSWDLKEYYSYLGSLTAPECNEAVIWIILPTPIYMSDAQYTEMAKVTGGHNYRKLQPQSKNQTVYRKPLSYIKKPVMVASVMEVVDTLATLFSNFTQSMKRLGK